VIVHLDRKNVKNSEKHTCNLIEEEAQKALELIADQNHCYGIARDKVLQEAREAKRKKCKACLRENK